MQTDVTFGPRNSFADALAQVEGNSGFDPDFAIHLGDYAAFQDAKDVTTDAAEGVVVASQLNSGTKITREKVYGCHGNHDAGDDEMLWYNKYVDDFGNNTASSGVNNSLRPFPMTGVENKHYKIETGNIVWLFLFDQNDQVNPTGRDGMTGGHPSGTVTAETSDWWQAEVTAGFAAGKNVITCAHHALKDTTIATGDNEGVDGGYHGTTGIPVGSGRLHSILTDRALNLHEDDQTRFSTYMAANSGKCVGWFCAHTHQVVGDSFNGRDWNDTQNGCLFTSVGSLAKFHGTGYHPQSVAFILEPGSTTAKIYKFLHNDDHRSVGFDSTFVLNLTLNFPFERP